MSRRPKRVPKDKGSSAGAGGKKRARSDGRDLPRRDSDDRSGLPESLREAGNRSVNRLLEGSAAGNKIEASTRRRMEQAFGADFRGVRVHSDAGAQGKASELDAEAVTQGKDIYLGASAPSPQSTGGRRLIAHELAHVVQQERSDQVSARLINKPGDVFEAEAYRAASAAATGAHPQLGATGVVPGVQRQSAEDLLGKLLDKALEEGIGYGDKGWTVGGVPAREIERGAEALGKIAQGDFEGAIDMFKPKNSAEKKALEEKIRKIKRDMDLVRPPDTAVEETVKKESKKFSVGDRAPEPETPKLELLEPGMSYRLGMTTEWVIDEFKLESAAIPPKHKQRLKDLADQAISNPNAELTIVGHADTTGEKAFNQGLSVDRAEAVRDYLVKRGVEAAKLISVTGKGAEEPITAVDEKGDRGRDRRVVILYYEGLRRRPKKPRIRLEP